jgi:serine/threonine protein kinase
VAEGQLTVGTFELHNCIASGNSTQIWEVSEPGSPMQLAMKLLLEDSLKDSAEKNTLKHEFKVGKSLDHPGFLRFHQIEVNRDHGFFTMDFVRCPSLKAHLSSGLPALQSNFRKMGEELCRAFHYMHEQGWLHRDIKPDNIMVNKAGESKIIDFSLSTRVKSGLGKMLSKQKTIQGTRNYIAPETILKKPADQRTDLYSLGITFYEVVTGGLPFAGESPNALLKKHLAETPAPPSAINPNVTLELEAVILKMIAKKPADRYQNMQEAGAALRGLKCFQEDPVELHERMKRDEKEQQAMSVDKRLDSRADAERTSKGITTPLAKKSTRKPTAAALKEEQRRKEREAAEKAAQAQPAAPGMPPGMPPQYPGMPGYGMPGMIPGQPIPGQYWPVQPYPGQQMPGHMYPGQPYPVQPYPGQPVPGQPYPGQSMPGQTYPASYPQGQLPHGQPQLNVPQQQIPLPAPPQQPEAPVPPAASPAPDDVPDTTEDDLMDLMDMIE